MNEQIRRSLGHVKDFKALTQLEKNVRQRVNFDDEVTAAFKVRAEIIAREMIAKRTNLDLNELTPAEEKIVGAASEYLAIKRREGSDATRTLSQLRDRGLIESAEAAVSKSKPTQGFETLRAEDLDELSYEQIIIDHPEEFSPRALWFARRTLGLPNPTGKAPARRSIPAQIRTEELLEWLSVRANQNDGYITPFTNQEAAAAIGMTDMTRHGRVYGNIQSRLDFACYSLGLPPLGLTATAPFPDAWGQEDRSWPFPVKFMQQAAGDFRWRRNDFERLATVTHSLSGRAYVLWRAELRDNQAAVQSWAESLVSRPRESAASAFASEEGEPEKVPTLRNPDWTREEHVLGFDLYLRLRGTSYPNEHPEVIRLSQTLQRLATLRKMSGSLTFRNANGVSMKMLNFRRVDPEYKGVGLPAGSKLEAEIWKEFADAPEKLVAAVNQVLKEIDAADNADNTAELSGDRYWVLVCNPAKWAVDEFLASGRTSDTWGVRPADAPKFAAGQLALVRVGVDRRSAKARKGRSPLQPGIYALCEIEGEAFPGTGANDSYWAQESGREPGWPTVGVRYLRNYLDRPLSVDRLRTERPELSRLLIDGFQAATFPLPGADFRTVVEMLGEDLDTLADHGAEEPSSPDRLSELERKFLHASPEVKTRVSKGIERGPIGREVKRLNGFRCQMCEALGSNPLGFKKRNGEPYVEAHHVMPVSKRQIGSLSATNIVTLCANHHRETHYGDASVTIGETEFSFVVAGQALTIPRAKIEAAAIIRSPARNSRDPEEEALLVK